MFCYIKYAEWDEVQQVEFFSKATSVISKFSNIKCTIPENKILLVNPNCYIKILIDYVAEQVKFDFDCASLDFCNENGELLKVNDMKPCDYAINVMHAQKTYIVVKCFRNEEGIIKSIEPLLFKYSKEYTDVLPRLKKYMSSRKHLERKKKGIDDLGRAGRTVGVRKDHLKTIFLEVLQ
ncbi:putative Interleukin 2 receptor, gamma chain [Popillia japonica]|uniref:Interleukin 2 receptor, gamma chain n=1 Tax=Popillia japonica TaxID=7064 RepID=A0AAW1IZM3_POPJA